MIELAGLDTRMKTIYSVLCVLGVALPLTQFAPWVHKNGLNIPLLISEAFGSQISAFAWFDVIVSAVVVLIFIVWEGKRIGMSRLWVPIIGLFSIGVSLGLPLFLLMREMHLTIARTNV